VCAWEGDLGAGADRGGGREAVVRDSFERCLWHRAPLVIARPIAPSSQHCAPAPQGAEDDGADFLLKDDGNDIDLRWGGHSGGQGAVPSF